MKEAPMTEGVKMIYDALDNLARPVKAGCEILKCPDFKRDEKHPDGYCSDPGEYVDSENGEPCCKRREAAIPKQLNNGWTEKLERLEKENKRLRHENRKISTLQLALKKACVVIHEEADTNSYMGCTLAAITEGHPECDCDCDKCLPEYFIELVEQEKRKVVRDEIEDRKRMDVEDQRGEFAKCNDLAEQIIEKGRELEEKMRR